MVGWIPIYTVDAFTKKSYSGNPAGVCLIPAEQELTREIKQKIAAEMNLSETAFISLKEHDVSFRDATRFDLCWFTPNSEVGLCGHATLASAKVIFSCVGNPAREIYFGTRSGELRAVKSGDDSISIFLPENKPIKIMRPVVEKLIDIIFRGEIKPMDVMHVPSTYNLLLRCPDYMTRQDLEDLQFDINQLLTVEDCKFIKGIILTLRGGTGEDKSCVDEEGERYDFLSRYFAPWYGVPEDPVTGSAHTTLTYYWSQQLEREKLYARQCSKRGGELQLTYRPDEVELSGFSRVILEGKIFIE